MLHFQAELAFFTLLAGISKGAAELEKKLNGGEGGIRRIDAQACMALQKLVQTPQTRDLSAFRLSSDSAELL